MQKSKLITLLKTFTKQEMKDFEKFISSPYFSPGRNLKPLFNVLKKCYPEFDSTNLTEEKIFRKLYPGKKFEGMKSKHLLRVLVSEISVLAEKFLKYENNNQGVQKHYNDISFLKILSNRRLDKHYFNSSESLLRSFENEFDSDSSLFLLQMEWQKQRCEFYLSHDRQQETAAELLKQGEFLIFYFLTEILKIKAHLDTNNRVFNSDFSVNLVKEVMENINFESIMGYLKKNSFPQYPVVALYHYMALAQLDFSNDTNYHKFKQLLKKYLHLFDHKEKHNLFVELESCCWRRVNQQETSPERHQFFKKELFELYKSSLKEKIYKSDPNGFMRINIFRNIIIAALNMREFEWLERFAKTYSKELAPEHRENMLNYSLAIVKFRKGEFEKSLNLMSKVKYEYFYLRIDVKNWMLQSYYELNMFEQAYALIDAYRHFLSGNKNISDLFHKSNNDFLNCYIKLLKIKNGDDSISLESINSEVSGYTHFIHKGWVLRKVKELENK